MLLLFFCGFLLMSVSAGCMENDTNVKHYTPLITSQDRPLQISYQGTSSLNDTDEPITSSAPSTQDRDHYEDLLPVKKNKRSSNSGTKSHHVSGHEKENSDDETMREVKFAFLRLKRDLRVQSTAQETLLRKRGPNGLIEGIQTQSPRKNSTQDIDYSTESPVLRRLMNTNEQSTEKPAQKIHTLQSQGQQNSLSFQTESFRIHQHANLFQKGQTEPPKTDSIQQRLTEQSRQKDSVHKTHTETRRTNPVQKGNFELPRQSNPVQKATVQTKKQMHSNHNAHSQALRQTNPYLIKPTEKSRHAGPSQKGQMEKIGNAVLKRHMEASQDRYRLKKPETRHFYQTKRAFNNVSNSDKTKRNFSNQRVRQPHTNHIGIQFAARKKREFESGQFHVNVSRNTLAASGTLEEVVRLHSTEEPKATPISISYVLQTSLFGENNNLSEHGSDQALTIDQTILFSNDTKNQVPQQMPPFKTSSYREAHVQQHSVEEETLLDGDSSEHVVETHRSKLSENYVEVHKSQLSENDMKEHRSKLSENDIDADISKLSETGHIKQDAAREILASPSKQQAKEYLSDATNSKERDHRTSLASLQEANVRHRTASGLLNSLADVLDTRQHNSKATLDRSSTDASRLQKREATFVELPIARPASSSLEDYFSWSPHSSHGSNIMGGNIPIISGVTVLLQVVANSSLTTTTLANLTSTNGTLGNFYFYFDPLTGQIVSNSASSTSIGASQGVVFDFVPLDSSNAHLLNDLHMNSNKLVGFIKVNNQLKQASSSSLANNYGYIQFDPTLGLAVTTSPGDGYILFNPTLSGITVNNGQIQIDPSVFGLSLTSNGDGYIQFNPAATQSPVTTTSTDNAFLLAYIQLDPTTSTSSTTTVGNNRKVWGYLKVKPSTFGTTSSVTGNYFQFNPVKTKGTSQASVMIPMDSFHNMQSNPMIPMETNPMHHTPMHSGHSSTPGVSLFLRMFQKGEVYTKGNTVIQNFYTDGDFNRMLMHFHGLPVEDVVVLEGGEILKGHLKGYIVTACKRCGPQGKPMLEFVPKYDTHPIIVRRFLYIPPIYSGYGGMGGTGHSGMGGMSGPQGQVQEIIVSEEWVSGPIPYEGQDNTSPVEVRFEKEYPPQGSQMDLNQNYHTKQSYQSNQPQQPYQQNPQDQQYLSNQPRQSNENYHSTQENQHYQQFQPNPENTDYNSQSQESRVNVNYNSQVVTNQGNGGENYEMYDPVGAQNPQTGQNGHGGYSLETQHQPTNQGNKGYDSRGSAILSQAPTYQRNSDYVSPSQAIRSNQEHNPSLQNVNGNYYGQGGANSQGGNDYSYKQGGSSGNTYNDNREMYTNGNIHSQSKNTNNPTLSQQRNTQSDHVRPPYNNRHRQPEQTGRTDSQPSNSNKNAGNTHVSTSTSGYGVNVRGQNSKTNPYSNSKPWYD